MNLVNARLITDDVAGLAGFYASVPATPAGRFVLDFEVDDVDATYRRLAPLAMTWVMPPTEQLWGARSAMFRDPDGNLVNLFTRSGTSGGCRA